MVNQTVVHDEIYYSGIKGDKLWKNSDGSQGHYFEWKKPISKSHILCGSMYVTFLKQNYRVGEHA